MRVLRRRMHCADERGATMLEFAILTPVLLLLTFGAIEFGLAASDSATLRATSRAGARIGAALSKDPQQFTSVAGAVDQAVASIGHATPQKLWIYKANAAPPSGPSTCTPADRCTEIPWDAALESFNTDHTTWNWTAAQQWTCPPLADRIGITVIARYDFVTGLFGGGRTLKATTMLDLEPQGSSACSGTDPQPTS